MPKKKKSGPMPRMTADEVADLLNKDLSTDDDHPVIVKGSDLADQRIKRLPTGILSLDVALGGGWPAKQWSEVYGDESTGKTFVVFKTIAANQELDPNFEVVWVAAEEFVPSYAKLCGVDISRVHLIETNVMEDALDRLLTFIAARAVDMAVIDSLPMLVPKEESEKNVDDLQVALQARISGKFFRKVRTAGNRSLVREDRPVTGLIINQNRVDVGGWAPHGQTPMTQPGGKAKDFAYFCRVDLKKTDTIVHPDRKQFTSRGEKTNIPIGFEVRATVKKNKSGPQGRIAMYDYYTAPNPDVEPGSVDVVKDLFMTASMLDIIERRGGYYYLNDGTVDEDGEVTGRKLERGRESTFELLETKDDLREEVRRLVFEEMEK